MKRGLCSPLVALAALALLCPPGWGVDLYVSNVPSTPIVTPQIDNLGSLKRYHLRDTESAESLMVSCSLIAEVTCDGGGPPFCPETPPPSVKVAFSLIDESSAVLRTVTNTYPVTWANFTLNPFLRRVTTSIPSTALPLSGLDLTKQRYAVRAEVDPDDEIAEATETNNARPSADSFVYAIYSGVLNYGPVETEITGLDLGGICIAPGVPVQITSMAEWTHEWGTTPFNPTAGCYNPSTNADGFSVDLSAGPAVIIGNVMGTTPSGLEATLHNVSLDDMGAHFVNASLVLPEDVSLHKFRTPGTEGFMPLGVGIDEFIASGDFTDISDIGTLSTSEIVGFHGDGLPFYLLSGTREFTVDGTAGLEILSSFAVHNHLHRYFKLNPNDPRSASKHANGFPSNDNLFMGLPTPGATSMAVIDPGGITTDPLHFRPPDASFLEIPRTSFPRGRMTVASNFSVDVVENEIQPTSVPVTHFALKNRKRCPDGNCGDSASPASRQVTMASAECWLTPDGSLGSRFTQLGGETEWGKFETSDGTFLRDDSTLPGVFYMPGFVMPETKNETSRNVSHVLLGSRLFDGPGDVPQTLSPLKKDGVKHADKGNGFFAGLTMGPERLQNLDEGSGRILSDDQQIRFNGNAGYDNFDITDYTKYFVRTSGITGVFNTSFMGNLNIYGYDIDFRRFAFRQVYNKVGGKTFLDGKLDIPYPSEITVFFLNLQLSCEGDLGSGEVDSEAESDWRDPDGVDNDGDGLTDEGNQVLTYWKTPISINGMAFVPTSMSGDACLDNENRELELITLDDFNGFDATLTMTAIYPVDGKIKDQHITGEIETVYDEPAMSSEPGFGIRMQTAYLNQRTSNFPMSHDGFLTAVGLTDVPLFNDISLRGHFENPDPGSGLALPDETFGISLFRDEDDLNFNGIADTYLGDSDNAVEGYRDLLNNAEDANESGDPRPRAKYEWPSSGILKLNYPLNYNRSDGTKMPQFLGVKKTTGLVSKSDPLISIFSVPDYINPEKTKLSFGASADFTGILNFQVNLDDLGDIDNFLHNYLGVSESFSLENMMGNVLDAEELLHAVTGGDLTQILGVVVDEALDSGPIDPVFATFSEAVGAVERVPQEISARSAGLLEQFADQLDQEINVGAVDLTGPGGEFEKLYTDYAAFLVAPADFIDPATLAGAPAAEQKAQILQAIMDLRERVADVEQVLCDLETGIGTARPEVSSLSSEVTTGLADAQGALTAIKNTVLDPAGLLGDLTKGLNDNPVLQEIDDVKDTVQDVLNAIQSVDIGLIGSILKTAANVAGTDLDTSILTDAENTVDGLIASLEEIVEFAEDLIYSDLLPTPTIFNEAEMLLDTVIATLNTINAQIGAVEANVTAFLDNAETEVAAVKGVVQALDNLLDTDNIGNQTMAPDYNALVTQGKVKLNEFSANMVDQLIMQTDPGQFRNQLQTWQTTINGAPNDAYQTFVVNGFEDLALLPVQTAVDEITNELAMILDAALKTIPAPSVDDIKKIVRNAVLNSDPVKDLNKSFNDAIAPIQDAADEIATGLTTQINALIKEAIGAIADGLNEAISSVTSAIGAGDMDILSARIDGYAIANQQEIECFHIEAEFSFGTSDKGQTYFAALDVKSWNGDYGKAGCVSPDQAEGLIDAIISTRDISAEFLGSDLGIAEAALGFTLDEGIPIGIFGRVYTSGELNFEAVVIRDIGVEAGFGLIENYIGATAAGKFQSYSIPKIAFYVGKTCDFGVLERLDAEAAAFIGEMVPLTGFYVRGSVSAPIFNFGCPFTIGAGVDIGLWFFTDTFGGLFGGSVYGEIACFVSIKGKITLMGQKSGNDFQFAGNGWVGGGLGFCEPEDWNSLGDVRDDDWCITGDASFGAMYSSNGGDFSIDGPNVNCCD